MDSWRFTLEHAITIGGIIFFAGGAWVALKLGQRDLKLYSKLQFQEVNRKMDASTSDVKAQFQEVHRNVDGIKSDVKDQFQEVHREMAAIRGEFVRADVDRERDKNIDLRMAVVAEEVRRANTRIDELNRKP